jgi:hypothetical protein
VVLTDTPQAESTDTAELLIEEARRRQRRRWLFFATLVVVAAAGAVLALRGGGSDSVDASTKRGTSGAAIANAKRASTECVAARNPKVGLGDGLPPKGYTDEVYVRDVARGGHQRIASQFPGTVDVRVEPRNGQVWSRDSAGQVVIESLNDYWIVVELRSSSDCPAAPSYWNGVPLQFVAPA